MPLTAAQLAALRRPLVFEAELAGQRLQFETTWGVFSPRAIDAGSRLLVEQVQVAPAAECLDLGCGYGAIGLTLAALAPRGRTLLVDKDFVAVELARRNAARNGLHHVEVVLSNGFDQIAPQQRFDLIAANLPAKVGKELLMILLHDAYARLRRGGQLYVVTITGLRQFIQRHLEDVFGNYAKLKQGRHYTVAWAQRR